ncbi:MAG: hypothetical protein R3C16_02180 [Hyphomonadaceae bacterium]
MKHYTAYPTPKHAHERVGEDWVAGEHGRQRPVQAGALGGRTISSTWKRTLLSTIPENVTLEHSYFYPQNDVNAAARKVLAGEAG